MKKTPFLSPLAFTLTEILVTMTIVGFVMAGVMTFYISTLQSYYFGEQKLLANSNARNFTESMMAAARDSNYLILYQSFYPYTTPNNAFPYISTPNANTPGSVGTGAASTPVTPFVDNNATLDAGDRFPFPSAGNLINAGDYIVFVTYNDQFYNYNPATTPTVPNPAVVRLVAFWIAPNRLNPNQVAMYSFDTSDPRWLAAGVTTANISNTTLTWTTPWGVTFPAALNSPNDIENMLPQNNLASLGETLAAAATDSRYAKIVVNDVRGETVQSNLPNGFGTGNSQEGLNFMYLSNTQGPGQSVIGTTSLLVNSRILDGNAAKHVTDTYNFTINPNG